MWPGISAAVQDALTGPHSTTVRVSATTPTQGVLTGLEIIDGAVNVTSSSAVRRSCSIEVDPSKWPASVYDPLSPISSEILVEYGIRIGSAYEWIPVFTGPVQRAKRRLTAGSVGIEAAGRELRVAEDRMDAPASTVLGAHTVLEITRLIQESIPGVTVTDLTGSLTVAAQITIDRERWRDGVEKLADSLGAEVYADPLGNFVIRSQPVLDGTPVLVITAGEHGTLVDGEEELTRERTYNRVIVEGIRSDGTAPVRSVVSDVDPDSPTLYGGAFGKRPRFYSSPLLTTIPQCDTTAAALLARARGMQATITLEQIPHPGLEAGDLIQANLPDGRRQLHIVDGFNIPLKVGPVQRISSRSLDLPSESGG
jgi:hypothetical protein